MWRDQPLSIVRLGTMQSIADRTLPELATKLEALLAQSNTYLTVQQIQNLCSRLTNTDLNSFITYSSYHIRHIVSLDAKLDETVANFICEVIKLALSQSDPCTAVYAADEYLGLNSSYYKWAISLCENAIASGDFAKACELSWLIRTRTSSFAIDFKGPDFTAKSAQTNGLFISCREQLRQDFLNLTSSCTWEEFAVLAEATGILIAHYRFDIEQGFNLLDKRRLQPTEQLVVQQIIEFLYRLVSVTFMFRDLIAEHKDPQDPVSYFQRMITHYDIYSLADDIECHALTILQFIGIDPQTIDSLLLNGKLKKEA